MSVAEVKFDKGGFNWTLDYERGACKFEAISGKRQQLFNEQEQSIHSVDEISNT